MSALEERQLLTMLILVCLVCVSTGGVSAREVCQRGRHVSAGGMSARDSVDNLRKVKRRWANQECIQ